MKIFHLLCLALAALITCGCTHHEATETPVINTEKTAAELTSLWADYLDAWKRGDHETCLSYMTEDDYINMPSLASTTDFAATGEMFINLFENNIIERADFTPIELFVHDSMAYEFGYLDQEWINRSTGDTMQFKKRCMSVWKKTVDGSWRLHRWMAQD
jgi:ketosteroid isomerase-like protein